MIAGLQDYELIAQELSSLAQKVSELRERMAEVEKVNARLEEAALTTARALEEISGHWEAVYIAMRRRNNPRSPDLRSGDAVGNGVDSAP